MVKKWAGKNSGQKIHPSFSFLFLASFKKMRDEMRAKWESPSLSRSDAQGVENVSVFVSQMQLKL